MPHRQLRTLLLAALLSPGAVGVAVGGSMQASLDFNARIHAELQANDPQAEALLRDADEARGRGDHRTAADLYARVFDKAPTFVHALRRQGGEELSLGNRDSAVRLLEKAVAMERSASNLAALAIALVHNDPTSRPSTDDRRRARDLAREAATLDRSDPYVNAIRGQVALVNGDLPELDAALMALTLVAPDDVGTRYLSAISQVSHGDAEAALRSLEQARKAGLPDEPYQRLHDSILKARPLGPRLVRWGGITAEIWIVDALLLLAAGSVLSVVTLRRSERVLPDAQGTATGFEAFLRRSYRIVLWICCAYYYVSMPILLALVLLTGGGLIYAFFAMGQVPVKLVVIIGAVTLITGWSIPRSMFVRSEDREPG
jgi:tetratricopeptide (TPR) repeat protein